MCYHKSQDQPKEKVEYEYGVKVEFEDDYKEYFHVSGFSHGKFGVITNENPKLLKHFHWGLIPFWVKDASGAKQSAKNCLNAIGEEIFEKPSFRDAIIKRRCLIPVTGFYEWREENDVKYPYFIKLKSSEIFSFAGVWSTWTDKVTGEEKYTYSVVTTAANPLMAKVHNKKKRMPLVLSKEDGKIWLDNLKKEDIKQLIRPYPSDDMTAYTITKRITDKKLHKNCPEVKEVCEYEGIEAILDGAEIQ